MSSLLGPNGEPLNPAQFFQLVDDATVDEIYDAFDPDAPMTMQIEWTGRRHNLIVFGWSPAVTDEGDDFEEFRKVSVPIQIPPGFTYVNPGRTIQ